MARAADFDLAKQLAQAGFTPAQRDAAALVELVVAGDEPTASRASVALAGLDAHAVIEVRMAAVDDGARARLVGALGLRARKGDGAAKASVIACAAGASSRARRAAIVALGKLAPDAETTAALLARWDAGDASPEEKRSLAEALGKLGGDAALARLRGADAGDDGELARRRDRALLMAERDAGRDVPSEIDASSPPLAPLTVRLGCRAGLAGLLAQELAALAAMSRGDRALAPTSRDAALAPVIRGDAAVDVTLAEPWHVLFASRLWATAGIRIALPPPKDEDLAAAITQALVAPAVRAQLAAWTRGPIRWRLGFAHGHKRAIVWRVAREVAARAPELINDPTATTWDVLVDDGALEIVPKKLADPRFAWRVADVPAASHPTVAAALARVAGARAGDRVWDPFVGSGAELIERAQLGPCTLIGSDLADDALAAARANLAAAQLTATLSRADACTHAPGPVDLVITNPPLGSRVRVDAAGLLVAALPNLARQLAPGGRLVWITPATRKTSPAATALGLTRSVELAVDLGGVRGHLERWDR